MNNNKAQNEKIQQLIKELEEQKKLNIALSQNIKIKTKTLKIRLESTKTANNYHFSVNSLFTQEKLLNIIEKYKQSEKDDNNCFIVSNEFDEKLFNALKVFCETLQI